MTNAHVVHCPDDHSGLLSGPSLNLVAAVLIAALEATRRSPPTAAAAIAAEVPAIRRRLGPQRRVVERGRPYHPTAESPDCDLLDERWYRPEAWGTWARWTEAGFTWREPVAAGPGSVTLTLELLLNRAPSGRQSLSFFEDGKCVKRLVVDAHQPATRIMVRLSLPAAGGSASSPFAPVRR
jgi:hypothetical protein